jgi:hypothetical protein
MIAAMVVPFRLGQQRKNRSLLGVAAAFFAAPLLGEALASLVVLLGMLGSFRRSRRHLAPSPPQPRDGMEPAGRESQRAIAVCEPDQ